MAGGVGQKQVEVHPADAVSGELRCIEFEGSHLAGPTQRRLAGFGHGSEVQFKTRASALESLEARRAHDLEQLPRILAGRSEERSVGKECASTCRSRGSRIQ